MATLSITIPDAIAPRVIDALSAMGGWTEESTETKQAVAKKFVAAKVRENVRMYENMTAPDTLTGIE